MVVKLPHINDDGKVTGLKLCLGYFGHQSINDQGVFVLMSLGLTLLFSFPMLSLQHPLVIYIHTPSQGVLEEYYHPIIRF